MLSALIAKDMRRHLNDRRAFVANLVLPLVITGIMGLSFGGSGGSGLSAIPVAMVGADVPDPLRDQLVDGLQESGFFTATWTDSTTADAGVRAGTYAAAVVLPDDMLPALADGRDVEMAVWKDPGSPLKAGIVAEVLARGMRRFQAGEAAYRALWPEDMVVESGETDLSDWFEGDVNDIWKRFRDAEDDPALTDAANTVLDMMDRQVALGDALAVEQISLVVKDKAPAGQAQSGEDVNLFNYFLPSFAVFFLMFAVAASVRDIHRERVQLTLQRQLMSPLTGTRFLVGKWVAAVLQGLLQLGVLFVAGALLFGVNLGPDPFSLAVVALLTCTAAAGVFLLLALITPSEKVNDNLGTVVILVSAMIGGNFVPIDALPGWVHTFGRLVFNYWANLGFTEVIVRDRSLAAALGPVLVLAALTVTLFVVNVLLFALRSRRGGLA